LLGTSAEGGLAPIAEVPHRNDTMSI